MVNPPNNSSSQASPATLGDIRLDASSSETLRYLSTRVGELVEARVVKVSAIVDAEIAKANSRLIPTGTGQTTGTGQNSNQAAKAYDVLLNVGGQQLAVKSELAPRLGQILQLEVQSSQQLRIVDLGRPVPSQNTVTPSSQNLGNPGLANTAQTAAADALLANRLGNTRSTALPTQQQLQQQSEQTRQLLQLGLRDTLPKQTPRELLLGDLQRLATLTSAGQISAAQLNTTGTANSAAVDTANRQLQNALTRLGNSVAPLNTLVQPDGLKQAVQNSGVFYENKIATLLSAQSATSQSASRQPTSPLSTNPQSAANSSVSSTEQNQYVLRQLSQGPTAALQARAATNGLPAIAAAPLPLAENATLQRLAANTATTAVGRDSNANIDNKLALLSLLGSIKHSLAVTGRAGADNKTHALTADNSNLAALWQLIPQASVSAPAGNIDAGETDDGLLQLLRMALGVVARTQSHQLLAVNTQLAAANADSNISQSLTMELPLWVEQKINLVDLRVDSEKPQRNSDSSQDKVWNARLQFDLDQYGQLIALATLRGKTVAAVLWASESGTADSISKELNEVAENFDRLGLTVQNLQCRVGEPEQLNGNQTINLLDTEI